MWTDTTTLGKCTFIYLKLTTCFPSAHLSHFGHVRLCATLWTVARQAPLSMGFPRKEYWSVLPCPPPGDLPNPRIKHLSPASPALQAYSLPTSPLGIPMCVPSVQFSSVAQLCLTLCDPMNHSIPGLPVHHQLPELTQTHVHQVGDAIQPSHPLLSPSPPAPNPSQHQGLFQWVNFSYEVAKLLEFQLQHQSFQGTPRTDLL